MPKAVNSGSDPESAYFMVKNTMVSDVTKKVPTSELGNGNFFGNKGNYKNNNRQVNVIKG